MGLYFAKEVQKLLDRMSVRFGANADQTVRALIREVAKIHEALPQRNRLSVLKTAQPALAAKGDARDKILKTTYHILAECARAKIIDWKTAQTDVLGELASRMLRKGGPPEEEVLADIIDDISPALPDIRWCKFLDVGPIVAALAKRVGETGLRPRTRRSLTALYDVLMRRAERCVEQYKELWPENSGNIWNFAVRADERRLLDTIKSLIDGVHGEALSDKSEWERGVTAWIAALSARKRDAWSDLIRHAATGARQRVPSHAWLKTASEHVEKIGAAPFAAQLQQWCDAQDFRYVMTDSAQAVLRGLILAAASAKERSLPSVLGRFGERCYKKIPGYGPGSIKLGNACMTALALMPKSRGGAELARLKQRIRYASGRQILTASLADVADRAGMSIAELEERNVPTFSLGLDARRSEKFGKHKAFIVIRGSAAMLEWEDAGGKPLRALPASVRKAEAEAIKNVKRTLKDLSDHLAAQRQRIESLYLDPRQWRFADWRRYYLDHPLVGTLARRLIWTFDTGGKSQAGLFLRDAIRNSSGAALDVASDATVRLWHPIEDFAAGVSAWRGALEALDIVQPFKQAHREIYPLTDAERQTGIYSNRFAAHILRQHQFTRLCRQRGWRYGLQGAWDSHNIPSRSVPSAQLEGQFWVEAAGIDGDEGVIGFGLVVSDQVRFIEGQTPRPLAEVPALVFSEIMRDIDLFVSVCSVGNDPNWYDGGPQGRFHGYWQDYAFGALNDSALARKQALASLLPRLRIAPQCRLGDRDLIVAGRLRTYKIHLRSANVRMEPNDAYLCIVLDRGKSSPAEAVRLPFEGDQVLSLILSKAFLLVDDDKIGDPTIVSQISSARAA
jgi:hypothetical protein